MSLVTKIADLRAQVDTAKQRRSDAAAAHKVAQKQLADIDAAITALGYDPAMSDDQLAALEAKLEVDLDAASLLLTQEVAALDEVLAKAKAAGVL